jgi:putative membrane protein
MARPFLTDEAKQAFSDAIAAVEGCSSAELVVAVRARSGSYLHADLLAGLAVALAVLVTLLFSPWPFGLVWFVVDPLLAGLLGGLIASRSPFLRRALTSRAERRRRVETAARSTFVEKRIHRTAGRTGILLYVSVLEREAEAVVDLGVEKVAATEAWGRVTGEIREAVRRGADGVEVAGMVRALGALLSPALARADGDVDELANEVCAP